jgi:hypothetical protein
MNSAFLAMSPDERNAYFAREARDYRERKSAAADGADDGPLPLFPPAPAPAEYPAECLGALRPVAEAIARKIQTPVALAAQSVLAVSALAVQGHCDVVLPYGQRRPVSLFLCSICGSGDRKTSGDNEAARAVGEHEKNLREKYRDDVADWKIASAAWHAEKRRVENDKSCDLESRRSRLADLGPEPEAPLAPYVSLSDLTLDGLTKNWINAHASLAVLTSEGATFTAGHAMSDDARLRTAGALSELWDGRPIKRVRAGDGVAILPGRRLSLHVMLQPEAAAGFVNDESLRDQGLLSRALLAAPETLAGGRFYRAPAPQDERTIEQFAGRILRALEKPAPMAQGARNELSPRPLSMSAQASGLWVEFFNHVERQSGRGKPLAGLRDFASKAGEHAARLAAVLTLAADLNASAIEADAMADAVGLMNFYIAEAERLRGLARVDARLQRAGELLEWLQGRGVRTFLHREILRLGPPSLRTKSAADDAASVLLSHRWLVETSARPRTFTLREGS